MYSEVIFRNCLHVESNENDSIEELQRLIDSSSTSGDEMGLRINILKTEMIS